MAGLNGRLERLARRIKEKRIGARQVYEIEFDQDAALADMSPETYRHENRPPGAFEVEFPGEWK
jgi:hypothetical protein